MKNDDDFEINAEYYTTSEDGYKIYKAQVLTETTSVIFKENDDIKTESISMQNENDLFYISDISTESDNKRIFKVSSKSYDGSQPITIGILTGINIENLPQKLEYSTFDSIQMDGAKVVLTYSDGSTVETNNYSVDYDFSTSGNKQVQIKYNKYLYKNYKATFDVSVKESVITEFNVYKKSSNLSYYVGEQFNPSDITVKVKYENGKEMEIHNYNVSYDFLSAGTKTVRISYKDFEKTINVTVKNKYTVTLSAASYTTGDEDWYAYTWSNESNAIWVRVNNNTANGLYENVIFARVPKGQAPNWSNVWNSTEDQQTIDGATFVIKSWSDGQDGKMTGVWTDGSTSGNTKSVTLSASAYTQGNEDWYAYTWSTQSDGRWIKLINNVANNLLDNVIFARIPKGQTPASNWSNVWNQTVDLRTVYGGTLTITSWSNGQGNKMTGEWSEPEITTYTKAKNANPATITESGNIEYYLGSDGKYYKVTNGTFVQISLQDTVTPPLKDVNFNANSNEDNNIQKFFQKNSMNYNSIDLLGVQLKSDNTQRDVRFITVVNSDILSSDDVEDYGYIFTQTTKSVSDAKPNINNLTIDKAKHKYSCKNTYNQFTEEYGNNDYTSTNYKYITAAVNSIPEGKTLGARFYIEMKDKTVIYATYKSVEDGCVFSLDELINQN